MGRVVDETGNRYGRLTVVRRDPENAYHKGANWICRCDCGGERVASGIALRQGMAKSCGCIAREKRILRCACGYKGQKTRDWTPDWKCFRCSGLSPLAEPPKMTEDELFEKRVEHWRYYHRSAPTSASHDVMLFLERLEKVTKERDMAVEQNRYSKHEVGRWVDRETKAVRELDEARERNADLRTMLEQVTRDRDHVEESLVRLETQRDEARSALAACPDCAMWAERSARWHDDMQRAERERDGARREADRFRHGCTVEGDFVCPNEYAVSELTAERNFLRALKKNHEEDFTRVCKERDEARAEVARLNEFYQPKDDSLRERIHAAMGRAEERHRREQADHAQAMKDAYRRGAEAMREACVKAVLRSYDDDEPIVREVRALPIPEEP